MLIVDVRVGGAIVARRVLDVWSEKDHPRKAGKFVKKGEGVGAANELHEKHGVTGSHVIVEGEQGHSGHGMTVREFVKQHGPKAAQQLLDDHAHGTLTFDAPAAAHDQHYEVYDPRTKKVVASGSLKDVKKQGIYVYSKHAVAADLLGSARLGGGATNNKGEHKGKTYVLRAASQVSAAGAAESATAAKGAPPAGKALAASAGASPDASGWKNVGPQMGSNPGGIYEDEAGDRHYVKMLKSAHHVESERLANALYEKLGLHTAEPQHVQLHGKDAIASKMQKLDKFDVNDESHAAQARKHFVAHAFLANHDATGLHQDNHAFVDGEYHVVDAGGSLKYRAQGGLKSKFDGSVDELDTMRDAEKNAAAHAVFGKMTSAEIAESAKAVTSLSSQDVKSLVDSHMKSATPTERSKMISTLIARRDDIAKRVAAMRPKTSKYSNPAPKAPKAKKFYAGPSASPTTPSLSYHENVFKGGESKTHLTSLMHSETKGHYGKQYTLRSGAADKTPKFHVKTPLTNKLVAQGTIAQLKAMGISASEKQVKGALESGSHHLNSTFHSGEHKGEKYVLHKGEALDLAQLAAESKAAPFVGHASVVSTPKYDVTPSSGGYAGSDDWKRPDVNVLPTSTYLSHSKKQHVEVFPQGSHHVDHQAQTAAMSSYSGLAYNVINEALRKGKEFKYGTGETAAHLQKLAQRSKMQDDHVLWRGIKHGDVVKYLDALKPGEHYVDPAFLSTSHNKSTASSFAGYGGKGHLMVIRARKGASGVHVGNLGQHLNEHEVILPHGTKLRYAGRSSEGHYVFDHYT